MTTSFKMQEVVSELRSLAKLTENSAKEGIIPDKGENFGNVLAKQLENVNELHLNVENLEEQFSLGNPDVSLPRVMLEKQKSDIYTGLLVESRNKIINAYNEIMNMSI